MVVVISMVVVVVSVVVVVVSVIIVVGVAAAMGLPWAVLKQPWVPSIHRIAAPTIDGVNHRYCSAITGAVAATMGAVPPNIHGCCRLSVVDVVVSKAAVEYPWWW